MGTIQEALKELRKTRVVENKTTRKSRSLKESNTKTVRVKKPVKESIMWSFDICNHEVEKACKEGKSREEALKILNDLPFFPESINKQIVDDIYNKCEGKPVEEGCCNESIEDVDLEGEIEGDGEGYWLKEDVNPKLVDMDGDVEVTDFNLSSFNESLNEAFNTSDIKKDPRFADLSDKLIRALIRIMEDDAFGDVEPTSEMFLQWIDDACNGGPLTPIALEVGAQLSSNDFYELIKNDPKFMDVFIKVCKKINWTDREGNALDSENKPLKRTSRYELVTDFLNMADNKQDAIDILRNAYYKDDYSSLESRAKGLNEDLASTLPVHALPENEVIDYINNIPVAKGIERAEDGTVIAKARPTCFFKLGYFKQVEVASKFRGGRGSKPEDPIVKIFKAIEYSKLYTGADYENLKAVKQFRKETGTERSGEKTGFAYQGEGTTVNKIGSYPNGDKALQSYLANNCKTKTKYYISINDGDVQEATRQEVAQYLTPANANKLLNPEARPKTVEKSVNAESGEEIVTFNPQAVNRLKIANIYMIGNLGHSIM